MDSRKTFFQTKPLKTKIMIDVVYLSYENYTYLFIYLFFNIFMNTHSDVTNRPKKNAKIL